MNEFNSPGFQNKVEEPYDPFRIKLDSLRRQSYKHQEDEEPHSSYVSASLGSSSSNSQARKQDYMYRISVSSNANNSNSEFSHLRTIKEKKDIQEREYRAARRRESSRKNGFNYNREKQALVGRQNPGSTFQLDQSNHNISLISCLMNDSMQISRDFFESQDDSSNSRLTHNDRLEVPFSQSQSQWRMSSNSRVTNPKSDKYSHVIIGIIPEEFDRYHFKMAREFSFAKSTKIQWSFDEIQVTKPDAKPAHSRQRQKCNDTLVIPRASLLYKGWTVMSAVLCVVSALDYLDILAYSKGFNDEESWFLARDLAYEVFFAADVFFGFFSEKQAGAAVLSDLCQIFAVYFKGELILDVIPLLPIVQILNSLEDSPSENLKLLILVKLIRVLTAWLKLRRLSFSSQLRKFFRSRLLTLIQTDDDLAHNQVEDNTFIMRIRVLTTLGYILMVITSILCCSYITGLVWFIICGRRDTDTGSFIAEFGFLEKTDFEKSVSLVYFMITTVSTVGLGDYYPVASHERVFAVVLFLISIVTTSVLINQLSAQTQLFMEESPFEESEKLAQFFGTLSQINEKKPIDPVFQDEVSHYFFNRWEKDRNSQFDCDYSYLNLLPQRVRASILADFLFVDFSLAYSRLFQSRHVFKNRQEWKGSDQNIHTLLRLQKRQNEDLSDLKVIMLQVLEPRILESGALFASQSCSCSEMLFLIQGSISVGYHLQGLLLQEGIFTWQELNRKLIQKKQNKQWFLKFRKQEKSSGPPAKLRFPLHFNPGQAIGMYEVVFNKDSRYFYKGSKFSSQNFGFFIRSSKWHSVEKLASEMLGDTVKQFKKGILANYIKQLYFPILRDQKRILKDRQMEQQTERASKHLSRKNHEDRTRKLILQTLLSRKDKNSLKNKYSSNSVVQTGTRNVFPNLNESHDPLAPTHGVTTPDPNDNPDQSFSQTAGYQTANSSQIGLRQNSYVEHQRQQHFGDNESMISGLSKKIDQSFYQNRSNVSTGKGPTWIDQIQDKELQTVVMQHLGSTKKSESSVNLSSFPSTNETEKELSIEKIMVIVQRKLQVQEEFIIKLVRDKEYYLSKYLSERLENQKLQVQLEWSHLERNRMQKQTTKVKKQSNSLDIEDIKMIQEFSFEKDNEDPTKKPMEPETNYPRPIFQESISGGISQQDTSYGGIDRKQVSFSEHVPYTNDGNSQVHDMVEQDEIFEFVLPRKSISSQIKPQEHSSQTIQQNNVESPGFNNLTPKQNNEQQDSVQRQKQETISAMVEASNYRQVEDGKESSNPPGSTGGNGAASPATNEKGGHLGSMNSSSHHFSGSKNIKDPHIKHLAKNISEEFSHSSKVSELVSEEEKVEAWWNAPRESLQHSSQPQQKELGSEKEMELLGLMQKLPYMGASNKVKLEPLPGGGLAVSVEDPGNPDAALSQFHKLRKFDTPKTKSIEQIHEDGKRRLHAIQKLNEDRHDKLKAEAPMDSEKKESFDKYQQQFHHLLMEKQRKKEDN